MLQVISIHLFLLHCQTPAHFTDMRATLCRNKCMLLWLIFLLELVWFPSGELRYYTGLFEMTVGVLTTCHIQYTWDRSICVFYLIDKLSKFLLHPLQVLYMCTLCDSTNINTIIEFVPNCLKHVSGDGFNGGSDSDLQFRDTCGKRRNINLILDVTP